MLKVGVLVSGNGSNFQSVLKGIHDLSIPASIEVVISSNPNAYALERARINHIPGCVRTPRDFSSSESYGEALLDILCQYGVELVILAGFLCVLSPNVIRHFRNKIINIHPSLIPAFCGKGMYGLKVHEAALKKGVKITGATVHFVDEGTDTGPIILQKAVAVQEEDTPEILQKRVMTEAEWSILPEAVRLFAENRLILDGNIVRIKDNEKEG